MLMEKLFSVSDLHVRRHLNSKEWGWGMLPVDPPVELNMKRSSNRR